MDWYNAMPLNFQTYATVIVIVCLFVSISSLVRIVVLRQMSQAKNLKQKFSLWP